MNQQEIQEIIFGGLLFCIIGVPIITACIIGVIRAIKEPAHTKHTKETPLQK